MKKSRVSIGLINPKSPDNVGSVLRAAGNFRVDSVHYTGVRYPNALMRQGRSVDMSRKISQGIPISAATSLIDEASEDMKIVCVEFAVNAIPLPDYSHPEKAIYIFGPEDGSIEQDLIDRADSVVYVPTEGCMNLAATVNVVLYDRTAKSALNMESNELILQSRDTNNRLKVS